MEKLIETKNFKKAIDKEFVGIICKKNHMTLDIRSYICI